MQGPARIPLVVVVDDEPAVLRALERLLRREPCEVVTTQEPRDVLTLAGLRTVDLVVTDHRMPGMTGAELVVALAATAPATPAIVLTGYPDASDIPADARVLVRRVIPKPWDEDELLSRVRECLPAFDGAPGDPDLTLSCKFRTREEILGDLARVLGDPDRSDGAWTRLLLLDLPLTRGSIAKLLSDLVRLSRERSARVIVVDASGLARTYLQGVAAATPLLAVPARREEAS